MNFAPHIALLSLLLAVPAQAQQGDNQGRIEIDTNLFCDTQHQVERFMMYFNGNGRNVEAAIGAVNDEMQMEDACVIATAAFQRGGAVSTVRDDDGFFDVLQITVVAVYTVNGLEEARPTEFFTLMPRDEEPSTVGRRPSE